jgi:hypothetical protein
LLSSSEAGNLRAALSQIQQEVAGGNCSGAGDRVAALETQVDSIHPLDRKLRSALRTSIHRLDSLVSADCQTQTTTTPTKTTPTTPDNGPTGATGTTGTTGEQGKPKKEKKGKLPPGQEKKQSGQPGGAGGARPSGEANSDGGQSQ